MPLYYYTVSSLRFAQRIYDLQQNYIPSNNVKTLFFSFENFQGAVSHNAAILQEIDFDWNKAMLAQPNSQVAYESEFKHQTCYKNYYNIVPTGRIWEIYLLLELLSHISQF